MIVKIYLEKACNMLKCAFIAETLNDVGLPRTLIDITVDYI